LQSLRDGVPGQGDRDRGFLRPGRSGSSQVAQLVHDRLLAVRVLRLLYRGLPRGRHPHGALGAATAGLRAQDDVDRPRRAPHLESAARSGQAVSLPHRSTAAQRRMIETLLLLFFGALALASAALMLVLRHPMRVALALITTMLCLGAIYGLLGVHAIAVFQVLIYVGAVMVFMI